MRKYQMGALLLAACLLLSGCGLALPWEGRPAAQETESAGEPEAGAALQSGGAGESQEPESTGMEATAEDEGLSVAAGAFGNRDAERFARSQLSGPQQQLYDRMAEAVVAGADSVTAEGLTEEEVVQVGDALRIDWPELFWLSGDSRWNVRTLNGQVVDIVYYLDYTLDGAEREAALARAQAAAADYLEGIEADWTDYEKVRAVFDRVVRRTDYQADQRDQSLYQVLVNGEGVCAGYARTVQYLLNRLGIFCTYITGTARGGSHAWNLVRLDGEYYYLDATWGDPVFLGGAFPADFVDYRYFCVTTAELAATHEPDTWLELPACTAEACNYYVQEGRLLSSYDPDWWASSLSQCAGEGQTALQVRFADTAVEAETRRQLLEEGEVYGMLAQAAGQDPALVTDQIRYWEDENGSFLYLFLLRR